MSDADGLIRNPVSLVVPQIGRLLETGEVAEPYRLLDPEGCQSITAQVMGRIHRPGPGGGWWYKLRVPIWSEVQLPDRITVEPDELILRAPARLVTDIEGVDYSSVPTRRVHPPARPPRSSPAAPTGTCPRPSAAPGAATTSRAGYRPATRTSRSTRRCASSPIRAARHAPPAKRAT